MIKITPQLRNALLALADELERVTKQHFEERYRETTRELKIQRRARELQRRGKANQKDGKG